MRKIAIKELAYFTSMSGSLTLEFFSNADLARGSKAHDYLQAKYNSLSQKEVYIKKEIDFNNETFLLHGYIDGVLNIDDEIIIEEIKSTTKELDEIDIDYHKEHLAQAKIYAYLYALEHDMDNIKVRLTYVSVVDYDTKSIDNVFNISDLEDFTFNVLEEYIKFLNLVRDSKINKEKTIDEIKFPYKNMRLGQKDFMAACYKALKENEILYTIAPTGIGKTIAALFSAIKTLKNDEKLFYLTAKTSGKESPIYALNKLKESGLKIKSIDITAKAKICNMNHKHCQADDCPFAIGYFDRLKAATFEIFEKYDIYDKSIILDIANKHKICAFEFSLYLSYYCDIVIADYNYVFDPKAHLIRYVDDDTYQMKVLVDEAHNLISRSKEMYSAILKENDIRSLRKLFTGLKPSIRKECNLLLEIIDEYRSKLAEKALYVDLMPNNDLNVAIKDLLIKIEECIDNNKKLNDKDKIMEQYFKLLDFYNTSSYFSDAHRHLAKLENDEVIIEYYCLDASSFILDTIKSSIKGIVFFSATLYPIEYHANLITKGEGKYLELKSPFDSNNLDIIINNKISTKYKYRNDSIDSIIEAIEVITKNHSGNYIVFFPSYSYLELVASNLVDYDFELIIQKNNMSDLEREEVINKFKTTTNTKVGFFVMGGAFAEGIDFIGDALTGVIVVGVGLPLLCDENNILKDYFEEIYNDGFDYAYTYPGFTKVIQAVGRVIRDENDRGIANLIDDRLTQNKYLNLMPKHWSNIKIINNTYDLKREIERFYKEKK